MAGYTRHLKPSEIMYSQNSIADKFRDGKKIKDTLLDLERGKIDVDDIPTIRVYKRDDDWVSENNRRLWVFRQLEAKGECDALPVQVIRSNASMFRTDHVTIRGGSPLQYEASSNQLESAETSSGLGLGGKAMLGLGIGMGALALVGMLSAAANQKQGKK